MGSCLLGMLMAMTERSGTGLMFLCMGSEWRWNRKGLLKEAEELDVIANILERRTAANVIYTGIFFDF